MKPIPYIFAVLLIGGCIQAAKSVDPSPTLVSARDMLSKAVEYLTAKPANVPVAVDLIQQSQKSYEQGLKDVDGLKASNAALQKKLDHANDFEQRGLFYLIGGAAIVGGVFLMVSGIFSTFPKAGLAIIAAGGASLAIAIIVPAIIASSWIVALCTAGCICGLAIYFTVYIIQRQHKANVENVQTVNVAKAIAASPEAMTAAEVKTELAGIQSASTEAINDSIRTKLGIA